jgi:hypothetical protein
MRTGQPSRVARGFRPDLCSSCTSGYVPGQPKLFDPRCEGCAKKKALGLRTGLEPPPTFRGGEHLVDPNGHERLRTARRKFYEGIASPRSRCTAR